MKIGHWLIAGIAILGLFSGGFLYRYRVENDKRVGKDAPSAVTVDALFSLPCWHTASQINSTSNGFLPMRCVSAIDWLGMLNPSPQPVIPVSVRISTTPALLAFDQPRELANGSTKGYLRLYVFTSVIFIFGNSSNRLWTSIITQVRFFIQSPLIEGTGIV